MVRKQSYWVHALTVFSVLSIFCTASASKLAAPKSCETLMTSTMGDGFVVQMPFDKKGSWGLQIFSMRLDFLSHMVEKVKDKAEAERVAALDADDTRAVFFQLQSLAAVYERHAKDFFKPLRAMFKAAEDAFGFKDLQQSLAAKAKELNLTELQNYFESQSKLADSRLTLVLRDWDQAKIEELKKHLGENKEPWLEGKDDRKFLTEGLEKDALSLADDIKKMKFDDPEIEKGLHELRRRVRWLVIQVMSLNHVVEYVTESNLADGESAWYKEYADKNPKLLENKYMKLDPAVVKKSVHVPQHLHAILTQIVSSIGNMKDKAEMQIEFGKAMTALKYTPEKIAEAEKALNANLSVQHVDHQELSRQYQHRITETGLLVDYVAQLKEMNRHHSDEDDSDK